MPSVARPFDIRADLERRVIADLVGPADGEYETVCDESAIDTWLACWRRKTLFGTSLN